LDLFTMLGIADGDLPKPVRGVKQELQSAWNRVDRVIEDEWRLLLDQKEEEGEEGEEGGTGGERTFRKEKLSVVDQVKQILLKEEWKRAAVVEAEAVGVDADSATHADTSGRIISEFVACALLGCSS
jgi:hypothetical protein